MAKSIKNLLQTFIQQPTDWKLVLIQQWHKIFGNLSTHVSLEKIYKDTIILGVYDSCWMQELYLLSPTLIKTINATLDQPRIKQVRFRTIGRKKKQKIYIKKREKIKIKEIVLSVQEKKALATIKDLQLRAALEAFLIRCYQEK